MKNYFARTTQERKLLGRVDVLIIILIAAICVGSCVPLFLKKGDVTAKIIYDGETVEEINLSQNEKKFTLEVGRCDIAVEGHEIFFANSPCPDKVCMNAGRLRKSGEFASCVPEKVAIILKGGEKSPDAVTY